MPLDTKWKTSLTQAVIPVCKYWRRIFHLANQSALQCRALNMIRDRFCNTFVTPGDFAISFWTVTRHKMPVLLDLDPRKIEGNQMSARPFQFDLYPGVSQHASDMDCKEALLNPALFVCVCLVKSVMALLWHILCRDGCKSPCVTQHNH